MASISKYLCLHKAHTLQSFAMPFLCSVDRLITCSVNNRFQFLIVMNIDIMAFWNMMQHNLRDRYQRFEEPVYGTKLIKLYSTRL